MFSVLFLLGLSAASGQLRFLSLGDWGGSYNPPYTTVVQLEVADGIAVWEKQFEPAFMLAIGDNFYTDGISCTGKPEANCSTDDTSFRFQATWYDVYQPFSYPWNVIAGNHDWHADGNVSAEVAFTNDNKYWNFPYYWYNFVEEFVGDSGKKISVEFVMIDTVILQSNNEGLHDKQLQWIEDTLAASTADWIFVAGHYPVYSIAEHGPTQELINEVLPLMVQYGVSLYINGHDHNLQYLDSGCGVGFVVTGSGHDEDSSNAHANDVPPGSSKYFNQIGGFGSFTVTEDNVHVDLVDKHANIVYSLDRPNSRSKGKIEPK